MTKKLIFFFIIFFLAQIFFVSCSPKPIIIKKDLGFINTPGQEKHPNAGGLIILDTAEDIIYPNGDVITKIRQAIKILNDRGKNFGEVAITYNSSYQSAIFSRARTIKPDGTIVAPDIQAYNEITPYAGFNLYSDVKQKTVTMPALEPGAVIDYEVIIKSNYLINDSGYSNDWFFQITEPILLSKYTITLPKNILMKVKYYNYDQKPEIIEHKDVITYIWKKENMPEIVTEPLMPSLKQIIPWLRITTAKSWDDIAVWYSAIIKDSFQTDTSLKYKVKRITENSTSDLEKMKAIFYFVENEIRYVGLELGINSIKPHKASEIIKTAYGDCKDQSALLIAMLREAGIEAYPALILSDEILKIDIETPTPAQFNHMIVYSKVDGKEYWLDPTLEVADIDEIPLVNRNHKAWVIDDIKGKARFIDTPEKDPLQHNRTREIKAKLYSDGFLKSDVIVNYKGDNNMQIRAKIKYTEPEKHQRLIENLVNKWCPSSVIKSFSFSDFKNKEKKMELKYTFETPDFANVTSKLIIFNPNILYRLQSTSFLSQENRKHPIQIAGTGSFDELIEIEIPSGYKIEEIPDDLTLTRQFGSYSIKYFYNNNILTVKRHSETKTSLVSSEMYEDFKNYYQIMLKKDNEKIVLRKMKNDSFTAK